ncbi:DCN1-like protein 3 [Gigantopelta aegis]|uniref:DCN1-like protein 3 n=1 Tax=Gigantopelta aegis TaxID=1735272 RepID=UPI001B88BC6D|nr:DCN1-like protein 3 [Gigantopelta aegis]
MGKCLSCCEPPGPPGTNLAPSCPAAIPTSHSRSSTGFSTSDSKDTKHPVSSTDSNPILVGKPLVSPTEKKMFAQYTKLPPITKSKSNGENKRMSLIAKDFSEAKALLLFDLYKDPTENAMLAEGIEKFCSDLDVRPEEFIVLVLAWKFEAEMMCRFTKDEFTNGCKNLKCDSIKSIQAKFPELLAEVQNKQSFKELYRWTYKFGLDVESGQRTLPVDMAVSLWKLVFSQHEPTMLDHWLEFIEKHPTIRGIPKDTWDMFLNFIEQVGDDLSTYDDTEAWPSLLDDFVEYENDRQNQNVKE